jgi:hypothetical protein
MPKNVLPNDQVDSDDGCVVPPPPMPPDQLARYNVEPDPDSEQDIASYIESQAHDEHVQHVEKIKTSIVLGEKYDMWDVTTDKSRWWVITNMTNLYPKDHFPSLDYTLSFHVGLMARVRSNAARRSNELSPFVEVFRRQEQAHEHLDEGIEAEEFQAVGMLLRESLLSLVGAVRRRVDLPAETERPQEANFIAWSALLIDHLCPGRSNQRVRQYMRAAAEGSWQLVNWLTHAQNATKAPACIAAEACETLASQFIDLIEGEPIDAIERCPVCNSRNLRTHFDPAIQPDGDYYVTCGSCGSSMHPSAGDGESLS